MRSSSVNPRAEPNRSSIEVRGLRFSVPATTETLQRVQTPTPPQELPSGTPARRATSRIDSFGFASAERASGVNVTIFDAAFTGSLHLRTKLSSGFSVYYSMRTQRPEGMNNSKYDETRMAEEIISILPAGVARQFSAERDVIRYAVRADGLRLRTIVLNRASLRRLIDDPARDVKVEYLQRDLMDSAARRSEFRYPRPLLHIVKRVFAMPQQVACVN